MEEQQGAKIRKRKNEIEEGKSSQCLDQGPTSKEK
jgi:hypothetical protein